MTDQMKQARDEKARTYGYNNAIYIDKAMLNKEGYQYLEEKPEKDFIEGTDWYRNKVWHDIKETPVFNPANIACNQILVIGKIKSAHGGFAGSVCQIMDDGTIYAPVSGHHYVWGTCPFSQWAYLEDLLPDTKGGER